MGFHCLCESLVSRHLPAFVGYEVISPVANFNYSTSYLFSSGPFSHMGLKANFQISEDFSAMLAITNPWDTNNVTYTDEVAFGLQLGFKGQYLNVYHDSGNNGGLGLEIDYTGGFNISDAFFLGINAAYNVNSSDPTVGSIPYGFYGAALYPQFTISDSFSLGLRGEYFATHMDGVSADLMPSVIAATLTGSYTVENLTIKPEVRLDTWANGVQPYLDADAMPSDNLAVFTLAAIYAF
jgi:hypothetical protein